MRIEHGRTPVADEIMRDQIRRASKHSGDTSAGYRLLIATILRDAAESVLREEVMAAREVHDLTWKEIGEALGVSAQAAHHKYAQPAES